MEDLEDFSQLLGRGEDAATAIGAPESKPLACSGLRELASRTIDALNAMGIGRGDRVAIVLRNSPEMAAGFVCLASGVATAPLNPGYREDELDFYLGDLKPKALLVETGVDSPARKVAAKLSIPIVELHPEAGKVPAPSASRRPQVCAERPGRPAPGQARTWPCCFTPAARRPVPSSFR